MALVKGTNSYLTVEEADVYFNDRLDASPWPETDPAKKAQALVSATDILDNMSWIGYQLIDNQSLAFPRVGEYLDRKAGLWVILDETVPQRILDATCELARHMLANTGSQDSTSTVKSISIGPINLSMINNVPKIPSRVSDLIKPLQERHSSTMWWRAN